MIAMMERPIFGSLTGHAAALGLLHIAIYHYVCVPL